MTQFVGLDIGYGFVKATNGREGFSFPSVVGEGHVIKNTFRTQSPPAVDELILGIDGRTYFVGKLAIRRSPLAFRSLSLTRKEGDDLKILALAALSLFSSGSSSEIALITGLPPGHMHLAGEVAKILERTHHITLYRNGVGREFELRVSPVEVVPQPMGTYWSQTMAPFGESDSTFSGPVGLIDIGYRTTDLTTVEDGEFVPERSKTVNIGVSAAYDEIASQLLTKHGLEVEGHALDGVVIHREVNVAGQMVDIGPIVDRAFNRLATKIIVDINTSWQTGQYERLLITGGGGHALSSFLLPEFPHAELVSEPLVANCKGYIGWANLLWKETDDLRGGPES